MTKNKLLISIIVVLGMCNLALISVVLMKKGKDHVPHGPKNLIIKKLDLDEKQIAHYSELISTHRALIMDEDLEIKKVKKELYLHLRRTPNKQTIDSLTYEIGLIQIKIEKHHYEHFEDIKNLCKPYQLKNYDELISEIQELFSHRKRKDKPRN